MIHSGSRGLGHQVATGNLIMHDSYNTSALAQKTYGLHAVNRYRYNAQQKEMHGCGPYQLFMEAIFLPYLTDMLYMHGYFVLTIITIMT